jgi:hypothetical protein|tara:strand:+ start:487 stop:675 length:189 start_codon:yes stop_codon:yes gene_type:complete
MTLSELKNYAEGISKQYPQIDEEVRDLYFLAEMEVEDGESENNECELAIGSIKELLGELDRI